MLTLHSSRGLAHVAVSATLVMWASSYVVVRSVSPEFAPTSLALIRLFAGLVGLTVLVLLSRRSLSLPSWRGAMLCGGFGVLWFVGFTVAQNWAGRYIDAGTLSLLVNLAPLLIALGAGLFFGEGFPRKLFVGILVALGGITLIAIEGATGRVAWIGVIAALIAALSYAAGVLVQKSALTYCRPLMATWLACGAGVVLLLPFLPQTMHDLSDASHGGIWGGIYLGLGPTALGFWFWAYAMTKFAAGKLAATSLVVPAMAVVIGAVTLSELPPPLAMAGGLVCLVGVAISQRGPGP